MTKQPRKWNAKFSDAVRGVVVAFQTASSFVVHLLATFAVICAAIFFRVSPTEWCILAVCIALVLAAETINSSIELLAKAVTSEQDERIRNSLDMAAGAVLILSVGAAIVGLVIFVPHGMRWLESLQ